MNARVKKIRGGEFVSIATEEKKKKRSLWVNFAAQPSAAPPSRGRDQGASPQPLRRGRPSFSGEGEMLLCKKPGGKLITAGLFSCGQSNPWALMTGPGPCGGWHLRQPRSCPPAGQNRPLCAGSGTVSPQSRGWEPCLPCCLGRLSYRLHWGKAAGAGQPPGPGLPRGTGAGPGCLPPVGVCAAPWRKPASRRAEGLGAQAQLMPPREGLPCAQRASSWRTPSKKRPHFRELHNV